MGLVTQRAAILLSVVAFLAGSARGDSASLDLSTPEKVQKIFNQAQMNGDAKTLRATAYYTPKWEKLFQAIIARSEARAQLAKAVTDRWGAAAVNQVSVLTEMEPPADLVIKVTGGTAAFISTKFPEAPPMQRFRKVDGQWKVDIVDGTNDADEKDRLAFYSAQAKVTADVARQVAGGKFTSVAEVDKLHWEIMGEIYDSTGGDVEKVVLLANRYYFGFDIDKDRAAALPLYRHAAELGSGPAMSSLGHYYEYGYEVPKDYKEAMNWYQKAAKAGDPHAGTDLGSMYERGKGVPIDYATALMWYRKGAAVGSVFATEKIGEIYEQGGHNVVQDYAKAVEWFKKAAEKNDKDAMSHLGALSEAGNGMPKDHAEAVRWYKKAADAGDEDSKKWLAAHAK